MSNNLLLIGLVHGKNKKLDWAKGRAVARKLPVEVVERGVEECFGMTEETAAGNRSQLNTVISELKAELSLASDTPSAYTWYVGTKVLHIRGGMSHDDSGPGGGWDVFANALQFPTVLKAIGFDL